MHHSDSIKDYENKLEDTAIRGMASHAILVDGQTDETDEVLRKAISKKNEDPSCNFPEGKLTENDAGEIKIEIGSDQGKVVVNFGKPIAWLGLDPKQARALAESLRKQSYLIKGK